MEKAGINKKVKGYKVDSRILTLIEEREHDLLNCEASRSLTQQKVLDDKLKLILETKCNLDHLILSCPNANPRNTCMNYLQVCANKISVNSLRVVGPGIYIAESIGNLDIPISVAKFKENSVQWFALLESVVNNVTKLETLAAEIEVDKRGLYSQFFVEKEKNISFNVYSLWLRRYFFPPASKDDPLVYPTDLYTSPIHIIDDNENNSKKDHKNKKTKQAAK